MIRKFFNKRRVMFWIVFFVVFIPAFMLATRYNDIKEERRREAERHQHEEKVRAEVLRRQSEKEKSDIGSKTELADARFPGIAHDDLTPEQAQKHQEWHTRSRELSQKLMEYSEKSSIRTRAILTKKKDRLPVILLVFPLLSSEQLKYARENALKTMPAEDVEFLFNALAEISTTKTAEQVAEDVKGIITVRQAYDIIRWELNVEFEQYMQGMRELYGAEEWERRLEETRERIEKTMRQKQR
ncbi:MAG: hypothetical protein OXN27_18950 [Candidatus Poribacteria bacterium]|nr:hypothetical protein [Candidatus Poribacteria bacterium]